MTFLYRRALLTMFLLLYGAYAGIILLFTGYSGTQFIARRLGKKPVWSQ